MFQAIKSPYLVPHTGKFKHSNAATKPPKDVASDKKLEKRLGKLVDQLADLQRIFYAHDKHALLLIFQAMDAAGKDGTIRSVMSGIDPAGCQVYSFKQPSQEELDHDFLWRTTRCLPERGRIGVFNRSYYEEVLVVRVHPEYLKNQNIPNSCDTDNVWEHRFESIREHEKHLAQNGTVILKFWLNVSKEEQRQRFLSRLNEPEKHWKFSANDVKERGFWDQYMDVYQHALRKTSKPWAPWYAIPADNKKYMRVCVAEIIVDTLKSLKIKYPEVGKKDKARFKEMRESLKVR
ncbi:MAG: polyphosphate kinase 2 family protein [Methylococcales bacterium]